VAAAPVLLFCIAFGLSMDYQRVLDLRCSYIPARKHTVRGPCAQATFRSSG
jgi:hypothetical protein